MRLILYKMYLICLFNFQLNEETCRYLVFLKKNIGQNSKLNNLKPYVISGVHRVLKTHINLKAVIYLFFCSFPIQHKQSIQNKHMYMPAKGNKNELKTF